MAKRYWLFKSEPGAYSYDDLVEDGVAEWDGVRNYQARNMLRDDIKECPRGSRIRRRCRSPGP